MKKQVISYNDFKNYISKICRDITLSDWRPDYVVGLTRGGLLPAVMISHYFNVPCETLKVSLRDHTNCESNLWMAEDAFGYVSLSDREFNDGENSNPLNRKKILVVDDINDTGATLNWIIEDWRGGCMPNDKHWNTVWNDNVRFAVVVDNLASKCEVKIDYCGLEINKADEDVWIDFPYEDWWTK